MLAIMDSVRTIIKLLRDLAAFFRLLMRSRLSLAAENLFLRKQMAMFQERQARPRRPDTPLRIVVPRNNWILLIRKDAVALRSRIPSYYGKILPVMDGVKITIKLLGDLAIFLWLSLRPRSSLAA
jgi:hypothetical protein